MKAAHKNWFIKTYGKDALKGPMASAFFTYSERAWCAAKRTRRTVPARSKALSYPD
jgi:hypothetical protein